jgi:uncharacterized protein YkwD
VSTLKRLAVGVTAGIVFVSLLPATTAGAAGTCERMDKVERAFVNRMNAARSSSIGDLQGDWHLNTVALKHTREMVARNNLYHTPSSVFRWRVTRWSILGENVGVGGSVDSLHKAFMNSPAHRANVLYDSFNRVGVGAIKRDGRMWVTIVFEARSNPGTPLC